eukprot:PhM_4_TR4171/c1_g1_i1/m.50445/K13783/SLC37A1_2; MFS transporter, OPA family, solute carrier family 37 (glycerol-3-phosphate transporter), member 1/2
MTFTWVRLLRVLIPAYVAYVICIMGRKPVSITRADMSTVVSPFVSGWIDTAFLASYSAGQFVYVSLRGHVPIRYLLGVSLIGSAACVWVFGRLETPELMLFVWGLNGIFQSIGWPSCMAIVTPWIAPAERGWIMGVWGSCQAVGGIVGNWLCAYLLGVSGWRGAFSGDATTMTVGSVLLLLVILDHPNRAGFVSPAQTLKGFVWDDLRGQAPNLHGEVVPRSNNDDVEAAKTSSNAVPSSQHMTALEVMRVPGVLGLALSLFCQKIVRYSLLFWLPYFLTKELNYDPVLSGYTSASFDVGGVLGSVLSGVFSDWYAGGKRRVMSCVIFIMSGLVSLLLFATMKSVMLTSISTCCVLTAMIGFFFFG